MNHKKECEELWAKNKYYVLSKSHKVYLEIRKYLKEKEIMKYLDVVVDGQFVQALHNPKLEWKGSSNQRVIDVKKTQEQGKIVLFDNYIH